MQVWITLHCLTKGIRTANGEPVGYHGGFLSSDGRLYARSDWHRTLTGATRREKELLRRQVVYLEKQLEKAKRQWRLRCS